MADENDHRRYRHRLLLKNDREVGFRAIAPSDGHLLVDLFDKMSPRSRYLRFLTNLKELPEQLLYHFIHLDNQKVALACVVEEDGKEAIIAVGRYAFDPNENIADFAIAVRDDWQHLGIGKALLLNIITIGKEHGISRFGSMMEPEHEVMKHVLNALGYQPKYSFKNGSCQVEIVV